MKDEKFSQWGREVVVYILGAIEARNFKLVHHVGF